MANKSITNLRTGYDQVPDVNFSGGVMLDAFSKLAFGGAKLIKGKIQDKAVDQAKKDAAQTVLSLDPMMGAPLREGADAATKAYNEEIKKGYLRRVELVARQKATELAAQNPADPQAIIKGAVSFASGAKANMPPEMQPQFDLLMQTLISSSVSEATSKRLTVHQKAREADRQSLFAMRLTDTQRYARTGDTTNMQHAFNSTAADLLSAVDPLTYPAEVAFKDLMAFRGDFLGAAVKGKFNAAGSIAEREEMLVKLARGDLTVSVPKVGNDGKSVEWETAPVSDFLLPEQRKSVMEHMKAAIGAETSAINRAESVAKEADGAVREAKAKDGYRMAELGELTPAWVEDNKNDLSLSDYKALWGVANDADAAEDDLDVVLSLEDGLRDRQDIYRSARQALIEGKITRETFNSLRSRNESLLAKSGPDEVYGQIADYWDGLSGKGMTFSQYDPIMAQFAEGKRLLDRWWDTFPEATDPKTGKPYNRRPTYDEGLAKLKEIQRGVVPVLRQRMLDPAVTPMPSYQFRVYEPGAATLDIPGTAAKIDEQYKIEPGTAPEDYPEEARAEIAKLHEYVLERRRIEEILSGMKGAE